MKREIRILMVLFLILSIPAIVLVGCSGSSGGGGTTSPTTTPTATTTPTTTPTPTPTSTGLNVITYDQSQAYNGYTLFPYSGNGPRVVQVDMQGNVVWEYVLPADVSSYTQPGFDAELLDNGNILIVLPGYGIREIDGSGNVIWEHLDKKVSHDADRLSNGNTVYNFGNNDTVDDAQTKEVDYQGNLVWSWFAGEDYYKDPYIGIWDGGWTHANAVTRMSNGNTLVSLRNFNLTTEVDSNGDVVWEFDWSIFGETVDPHEPKILANNHLIVALQHDSPYIGVEIDRTTGETVWTYARENMRTTRDANRLPNGNTLFVSVRTDLHESTMFEVTPDGTIVWEMLASGIDVSNSPGVFFKVQRLTSVISK
ncbi:MAG: PQQ-binding-like beta-propeller repeat protein [Candidatus Eremiobacteraeota bacterium]|nr:PQQ-binding-like beta-propeller repeat protein [Candidatus Eremiobacteraeota bacterium]